jgi:predicted dehydrogenase
MMNALNDPLGRRGSRRSFIKTVAVGAAGAGMAAAVPASSYGRILGANDRVRVAVVGIRGMGFGHIRSYAALDNVDVAALCDVDENLFAEREAWLQGNGKVRPRRYIDIRALLDDPEVDAISVATPNHWHALAGFWAAQAGKHSTLEKPATHNVFEGQQLIEASRKYKVFIQQHAERRSFAGFKSAAEFLHQGGLGEVYMAKGLCYKWRDTIGRTPEGPIPEGVHYDLWLGPAPKRPFSPNRFHYNWHWHWDYGNGDLGNQGVHQVDIARWGLGVDLPTRVTSVGAHAMFDDDQETPNVQMALFEFPNPDGGGDKKKIMQFEVRHWITNHEGGLGQGSDNAIGNLFYGSKGYMVIDLGGNWKTFMGQDREPGPTGSGGGNMYQNFVDTIRSGDPRMLEGDITEGHLSCALIHLANTSYRLGRSLEFDPHTQRFVGDDEANAHLRRAYREPYVITGTV